MYLCDVTVSYILDISCVVEVFVSTFHSFPECYQDVSVSGQALKVQFNECRMEEEGISSLGNTSELHDNLHRKPRQNFHD